MKLNIDGEIRSVAVVEVVPAERLSWDNDVFWKNLHANVHNHTVPAGWAGWVILDLEDHESIPMRTLAAGCSGNASCVGYHFKS